MYDLDIIIIIKKLRNILLKETLIWNDFTYTFITIK